MHNLLQLYSDFKINQTIRKCLNKLVIAKSILTLIRQCNHASAFGQYSSPVLAVVAHFSESTVVSYGNVKPMTSLFLKFCYAVVLVIR